MEHVGDPIYETKTQKEQELYHILILGPVDFVFSECNDFKIKRNTFYAKYLVFRIGL